MLVPVNCVPTADPDGTRTWRFAAAGAVPVSLYQATPYLLAAWFRTNVAVNPHTGANAFGTERASFCQSIASPREEKNVLSGVSPFVVAAGTRRPEGGSCTLFGSCTRAEAAEGRRRKARMQPLKETKRMRGR